MYFPVVIPQTLEFDVVQITKKRTFVSVEHIDQFLRRFHPALVSQNSRLYCVYFVEVQVVTNVNQSDILHCVTQPVALRCRQWW